MTSESGKKMTDLAHFLKHIVGLDRTTGAFYTIFRPGKDKHRPVVFFPDPSGDDTSQTLMTGGQIDHQYFIFF